MTSTAPVLIFGNPKSGGGDARRLFEEIGDADGVYLVQLPKESETWKLLPSEVLDDPRLRVIAAGGDGTVNWTLSLLEQRYNQPGMTFRPPVAIYPCGTGNDLSRAMGWGGQAKLTTRQQYLDLIEEVRNSNSIIELDTWQVSVVQNDGSTPITKRMLNYFSIGADAKIACDFEEFRTKNPKLIQSQLASKAAYLPIGMQSMIGVESLYHYVRIFIEDVNGEEVEVKGGHGEKTAVCQAITSIYAGQDLWHNQKARAMNDELFEFVILGGAISLGIQQMGVPVSRCVMQGRHATLIVEKKATIQIDGEGMILEHPSRITLEHSGKYPMIQRI